MSTDTEKYEAKDEYIVKRVQMNNVFCISINSIIYCELSDMSCEDKCTVNGETLK